MTIYEKDIRPDVEKIGPVFEGGFCEPHNRTVVIYGSEFVDKLLGRKSIATTMDVGADEIYVNETKFLGGNKSRNVVGPAINTDPLTREFFVYKSEE